MTAIGRTPTTDTATAKRAHKKMETNHVIREQRGGMPPPSTGAPEAKQADFALELFGAAGVLHALPAAILVTNNAGILRYMNRLAQDWLGVTHFDGAGRPLNEVLCLVDGATSAPVADPFENLQAAAGEYRLLRRADGSLLPVEVAMIRIQTAARIPGRAVFVLHDASRAQVRIEQLREIALLDDHTLLLRRTVLEERLARVLATAAGDERHALLFMDLDRFKPINDVAGHAAGDDALRRVATLLRSHVRERDTLARLGGDEFGLLMEHCPRERAVDRAHLLHAAVAEFTFEAGGRRFPLGISIGVAVIRPGRHDMRAVLAAADAACYTAKRQRRGARHIVEVVLE